MVFQETPIRINYHKPVITNTFRITYLVKIHSRFPFPLSHRHFFTVSVIKVHTIRKFRKRGFLICFFRVPLGRSSHCHSISSRGCQFFTEFRTGFTSDTIIGTGQITNSTITCTIGKEWSLQALFFTGLNVFDNDRTNTRAVHCNGNSPIIGK